MALADLIQFSSLFGVVFDSSVVIIRIVLLDDASTGSAGHGPIHLLLQSAEEIGFFLGF